MSGKLQREIHKARPFDSLQQEAFLNVIRTADHLMRQFEELLKPFNLSATQYNVLRILRGMSNSVTPTSNGHTPNTCLSSGTSSTDCQNGGGIPCKMIGEHMLTRDPDITRLLDRLESRSLITRQRDTRDRRIVSTRITPEGLRILKDLDKPVLDFHRQQFSHMPDSQLSELITLLESVRSSVPE